MAERESRIERAMHLLEAAYERQMAEDLPGAIHLCQASILEHPGAEAHTFLGRACSLVSLEMGRPQEAAPEIARAAFLQRTEDPALPGDGLDATLL